MHVEIHVDTQTYVEMLVFREILCIYQMMIPHKIIGFCGNKFSYFDQAFYFQGNHLSCLYHVLHLYDNYLLRLTLNQNIQIQNLNKEKVL